MIDNIPFFDKMSHVDNMNAQAKIISIIFYTDRIIKIQR